jgi:hypothetical protein
MDVRYNLSTLSHMPGDFKTCGTAYHEIDGTWHQIGTVAAGRICTSTFQLSCFRNMSLAKNNHHTIQDSESP